MLFCRARAQFRYTSNSPEKPLLSRIYKRYEKPAHMPSQPITDTFLDVQINAKFLYETRSVLRLAFVNKGSHRLNIVTERQIDQMYYGVTRLRAQNILSQHSVLILYRSLSKSDHAVFDLPLQCFYLREVLILRLVSTLVSSGEQHNDYTDQPLPYTSPLVINSNKQMFCPQP